jgi:2'-5' RNA ligase
LIIYGCAPKQSERVLGDKRSRKLSGNVGNLEFAILLLYLIPTLRDSTCIKEPLGSLTARIATRAGVGDCGRSAKEMKTEFPAYVVAEVPAPVSEAIQQIRDNLATPLAKLPVEITLGGSSGVGPIPPGSDLNKIRERMDQVFTVIQPQRVAFSGIEAFPGGSVIYLAIAERSPFDAIHQLLRKSEIEFSESPFPYTPHCSLRIGEGLGEEEIARICGLGFPDESFEIRDISLYSLEPDTWDCALLHRVRLIAEPDGGPNPVPLRSTG